MNYTLHTPQPNGFNLINNGGFTSYGRRWLAVPNTANFRSDWAVDNLDMGLYARLGASFRSEDNQLSGWDAQGVRGVFVTAPRSDEGYEITTPDPGNVLQVSLLEDGDLYLSQEIVDVKRLYGADISVSLGGVFISGKPELALELVVDGEVSTLLEVFASTFGDYRRVGGYASFPDKVTEARVRLRITGCAGDGLGISGVMVSLGPQTANTQFSSSLLDRVVPAGTVYMVVGDTCPSGYVEIGKAGDMVITSGTKAFQSMRGEYVRALGQSEHSHHPEDDDPLSEPTQDTITTKVPLTSGVVPVSAVQFGDYVPYSPYPNELPDVVLGASHTHTVQSKMPSAPPTFPVKYCGKF